MLPTSVYSAEDISLFCFFFCAIQESKIIMRSLAEAVVYMHDNGMCE